MLQILETLVTALVYKYLGCSLFFHETFFFFIAVSPVTMVYMFTDSPKFMC